MPRPATPHLRPPRFGLRQVQAFVCVADELHFGKAANKLFTSQPALSRMIHNLEKSVGLLLFTRTTRKVLLTAAGEAFAAECRLALSHLELAAIAARNAAEGRQDRLRLAYIDFAIDGRVPQLLRALRTQMPGVSVDLKYMPTTAQHIALLNGSIDVGFITGEFKAQNIRNVLVDQHEFVALLPEGHRLATRKSLRLTDLAREPFVIGSEDTFSSFRTMVFELCHSAGFFPNVVQEASSASGIFGLIAAGAGITIYSGSARNILRSGFVAKPLSDAQQKIPIFAASLADHPSQTLRRFLEIVDTNMAFDS